VRKPRSLEFRQKVLNAAAAGRSQSELARHFRVSQPTISRWLAQARASGIRLPPTKDKSLPADQHLPAVLDLAGQVSPFSIRAMQAALAAQGIGLTYGVLRRLMLRHKPAVDAARKMPRSAPAGETTCIRRA